MSQNQWTVEQSQAIEGRGGSILVTAAAGSGKTAVLVERVIQMLTREEDPVDADQLLVVTFSNAAAREMKQRISRRLWELSREDPGNLRLARQQLLLESAQISTIHAFCISLIRGHFQLLGIPAEFRIGDERETEVLRLRTVQELVEEEYTKGEDSFFDLVELLSSARSDGRVERSILKLHNFVRNHPFYEEWMAKMLEEYDAEKPLSETRWAAILLEYAHDALNHCIDLSVQAEELMIGEDALEDAYRETFEAEQEMLEKCLEELENGDWDDCCRAVNDITFGRLPPLSAKKYPNEERKKQVQKLRDEIKKIVQKKIQKGCFFMDSDQYRRDMEYQQPILQKLFELTGAFDRKLREIKLDRGLLDFGDLEHYALALLYQTDEDGNHLPSQVARETAERYREILVDEYQDTNGAQEMIFQAVSRAGRNLFMVGDVKQSIYRFRQARPEIFLRKKLCFTPYDGKKFPAKIALNTNFRSRREITGIINDLFSAAMCPAVGEMTYQREDQLVPRAAYDYDAACPVKLALVDPEPEEAENAEAAYIAGEIERLLSCGDTVAEKGEDGQTRTRPIRPGDICILLRSPRSKAERYTKALEERRLHFWVERQNGFLESREVAPVVAFLKVMANPLLDLELAQVLVSPLYRYTSDQVAKLRAGRKGESLYSALTRCQQEGEGEFGAFWRDYHRMRDLSSSCSPQELLDELYTLTSLPDKVRVMPQGEVRAANLQLLLDYAADYQQRGGDLGDFVDYLSSLGEFGCDLPSASTAAGDVVSIMSIHKSKGLEFPVVFLADTAAKFNTRDLGDNVLLNPELGVACILRDNRRMQEHDTIARAAMREQNRLALLSEELRLLYVAMTRARERLYLVATDPGLKKLQAAAAAAGARQRVSSWVMRSGECLYDWIAETLIHHPDFDAGLLNGRSCRRTWKDAQGKLKVECVSGTFRKEETAREAAAVTGTDGEALQRMRAAAAFVYPYGGDVVTPSKLSVSELVLDLHDAREEDPYLFSRRPRSMTRQAMTPTERGIAAHKFMQFADLSTALRDPEGEIRRLRDRGFITVEEAEQMDRRMIAGFFRSAIGRRVLAADKVYREIRFLREFSREELADVAPELGLQSSTVIQGIADCVILEGGRGTIIDYKTDRVRTMAELRERYHSQLELYRAILEEYLAVPIREKVIYSFALSDAITVP